MYVIVHCRSFRLCSYIYLHTHCSHVCSEVFLYTSSNIPFFPSPQPCRECVHDCVHVVSSEYKILGPTTELTLSFLRQADGKILCYLCLTAFCFTCLMKLKNSQIVWYCTRHSRLLVCACLPVWQHHAETVTGVLPHVW